jgi:hypothetical protein
MKRGPGTCRLGVFGCHSRGSVMWLPVGLSRCPGHIEVAAGGNRYIRALFTPGHIGEAALVVGGTADACTADIDLTIFAWFYPR